MVVASAIDEATTGVSFVFATVSVNVSLAAAKLLSAAVTVTSIAPTSPLAGVPLRVPVDEILNHEGRALPLFSVAV